MSGVHADGGLGAMLDELVRQNLERDPGRRRLLAGPLRAVVEVPDAGVRASVRTEAGAVRVDDGDDPLAAVRVRADGRRVLGLASVPLWAGLPDVRTAEGRAVLRDLATGAIRVEGLVRHLGQVRRLTQLLSAR